MSLPLDNSASGEGVSLTSWRFPAYLPAGLVRQVDVYGGSIHGTVSSPVGEGRVKCLKSELLLRSEHHFISLSFMVKEASCVGKERC